jgi:nicotinate phosphoribosyltransferase
MERLLATASVWRMRHKSGEPLLQPVMRNGQRLAPPEPLSAIRRRVQRQLAALPLPLRANQSNPPYLIEISNELIKMAAQLDQDAH